MFSKICSVIFVVLIMSSAILPQEKTPRSVFVSVHGGLFNSALKNFKEVYNSNTGFVYGLSVGLPTSTRSYLYSKATYFSKSGTPIIHDYIIDGGLYEVSSRKEGTAKFNEWIFNLGFYYKFFPHPDWTLGLNGGFAFCVFNEKQKNADGTISSSTSTIIATGFFVGTVLERNFNPGHFSIFFEPQYNSAEEPVFNNSANYGGFNFNLGVRYYFKERRVE